MSQAFKMWPFPPCTFQCHYVTLLLNKRLYYIPVPPSKRAEVDPVFICWTNQSGLCQLKRITDSSRQALWARVCVCVCQPLPVGLKDGKFAKTESTCWLWLRCHLVSKSKRIFFFLFMYLPSPLTPPPSPPLWEDWKGTNYHFSRND